MKRSKPWITAALQFFLLLVAVACASPWLEAHETPLPTPRRSDDVALASSLARPIYNRSVVLGGVYSAGELQAAIQHDPVVAAHYRGGAIAHLRPVTLTAGRAAYVSYRINDRIYWTRERVWIKPGETVLTDGTTVIRARCGNCISDTRGPVAEVDPAHGELDDFVVPPLDRGVDGIAGEPAPPLADLLELPFGPQVFASATPALPPLEIGDDDPFGGALPRLGGPMFVPSGSFNGPGPRGVPPAPPVPFLPPGTGTTTGTTSGSTGGTTDGSPSGGASGSPTGVGTGSPSGVVSGSPSGSPTSGETTGTTGFPGCCATTTNGSGTPSDGSPTSGNPFPTTAAVTTVSTSPNPPDAPEPGVLWLVACGVIGVASRSWRRR